MFTDSRSIDDRATAASFDTAYQKYAAATDSWFDGTPFSIDNRLAQCRRLMHIARTRVARRGADAGPLSRLADLETDARALTALREDLLTGAYDRVDNSLIAGVRITADDDSGDDATRDGKPAWDETGDLWNRTSSVHTAECNCGHCRCDDNGYSETHSLNGVSVDDLLELLRGELAAQVQVAHDHRHAASEPGPSDAILRNSSARHADCGDDEEFADGEDDEKTASHIGSLSPQDRRFVTLESSRFLADNTDTNNARELATRAMHHAQLVTSTYDVERSRTITAAFVQRVAEGAHQRNRHAAALRQASRSQAPALLSDSLPPETLFL